MLPTDEIVARVKSGRTEEYAEIVRRHQAEVWRAAAALLFDVAETEEVVQQVFVQAFFRLDQYRTGQDFGRWIRSIARNLVRDRFRTAHRETARLLTYRERMLAATDDAAAHADRERRREALGRCLEELPDRQRSVLDLRYRENLSFVEVASRLGETVDAVRRLASRVRLRLRDCIRRRLAEA